MVLVNKRDKNIFLEKIIDLSWIFIAMAVSGVR